MFHTYVTGTHGKAVDMGRAQFLMDKELIRDAVAWVEANPGSADAADPGQHQAIWADYCRRQRDKYGEGFRPDLDPAWDH